MSECTSSIVIGTSWGGLDVRCSRSARRHARRRRRSRSSSRSTARPSRDRRAFRDLLGSGHPLTRRAKPTTRTSSSAATVYLAAAGLSPARRGRPLALSTDEPVQYARPSIDVLLRVGRRRLPRALRRRRAHGRQRRRRARPRADRRARRRRDRAGPGDGRAAGDAATPRSPQRSPTRAAARGDPANSSTALCVELCARDADA